MTELETSPAAYYTTRGRSPEVAERLGLFCLTMAAMFLLLLVAFSVLLFNVVKVPLGFRSDSVASQVRRG